MDLKDINQFLHHLEATYPVNQWTINGIHIWPLVRICIGSKFNNTITGVVEESQNKAIDKWVSNGTVIKNAIVGEMKLFLFDFKHRQSLRHADVVIFGDSIGRNVCLPTGELMDHNLDPLRYELANRGYKVFGFEALGKEARYPRWSNSYPVDTAIIKCLIIKKISHLKKRKVEVKETSYKAFLEEYVNNLGDYEQITSDSICLEAEYIQNLANEFLSKLKKICPRLVLLTCWYSDTKMALTLAAHMLHIPVVDVQHGMAGGSKSHFAYYDWIDMPPNGYELLPDYMWTRNQADSDAVAQWGGKQVIPILGGYPTNLIWCNPDDDIVKYYRDEYRKKITSEGPAILFTLQWGTDYPEWIINFINEFENCTWLIRLHPRIDDTERNVLRKLRKKKNIVWNGIESFPLSLLLQNVVLHITMDSGVVIEAATFDCPSVVMSISAKEMYASQITKGIARYVGSENELSMAINEVLAKEKLKDVNNNRNAKLYAQGRAGIEELIKIIDGPKA